ncbi:FIST signal transduction protein [Leptothoe sp. PORK10 BA2]|uniref:FIST signal transduction protein n=1 Tax=Leptothoe sp. PORK10 BA2 TaxID=3110254 RepID=UPI002B1F315C|nr:FIST N-terminal domain-containing protein [Leptothoe sp. PORK10 BA2]MEA5463394.1 FIST N-terminal domain-containing protein [Leptothoe sp. PORK10 BA2]
MLKAVVGHSNDPDTESAIAEVLHQCQTSLDGIIPQAGILLAALDFDHGNILQQIHQTFPTIQLIGGTTDGEVSSILEFQQDSLVLLLLYSDEIKFHTAVGHQISSNPVAIAQKTAQTAQAQAQHPISLCITIPESLTTSGVSLLQGLKQALGADMPIIGGTTCDQWQFKQTYQFFGQDVLSDALPILLLSGPVLMGHGVSTGWTPIGKKGKVTKSEGNVLHEVDGQPALEFYQDYLGEIRPSPAYRLAVFEPNQESWYMRSSNGAYNETSGSITFFADIPPQSDIQVVRSSRDEIVESAQLSMQKALEHYPGTQPKVALFFSCTGRLHTLGTRTQEEYQVLHDLLSGITCAGFYTYGEIAPLRPNSEAQFHNETFVTLLLGVE